MGSIVAYSSGVDQRIVKRVAWPPGALQSIYKESSTNGTGQFLNRGHRGNVVRNLAKETGQFALLRQGQCTHGGNFVFVEGGKQSANHSLSLGAECDENASFVVTMRSALDQLLILQGLDDASQCPLGHAGFFGHVSGLLASPDPQNPEYREGDPTQVVVREHRAFH